MKLILKPVKKTKNQFLFRIYPPVFGFVLILAGLFFRGSAFAAVSSDPTAEDWIDQGKKAYDQAQYDEASADFKKALTLDSQNAPALYAQGLALAKTKRWVEARAAFQAAVEADSSNPKAWLGLAWTDEKTGNGEEAIRCYQKIFQLECESSDREIARERLASLGASAPSPQIIPPTGSTPVSASPAPLTRGWKPSLSLQTGGGYDDNLNSAGPLSRVGNVPLGDGFGDLAASFGIVSGPAEDSRFKGDAFYQYKSYLADTGFNSHNLLGKAAFETPLVPSFSGEAGVRGEMFLQLYGMDFYSDSGWLGLKFKEGAWRLSASYTYSQENFSDFSYFQNFEAPVLGLNRGPEYLNPNDSNQQVDVTAYRKILPGATLFAQYRFKDNQAEGLFYQYLANSLGAGAELFFFSGDRLVSGIQLHYLGSFRQYATTNLGFASNSVNNVVQQDWVNLFTAQWDWPLQPGWSASLSYRYEADNSNISFFSYTDNALELNISYQFL